MTVQAFSLAGEFHALSGPAGVAALAERAASCSRHSRGTDLDADPDHSRAALR